MNNEIMSEEAFYELVDVLDIVSGLTMYGRKSLKYWINKIVAENKRQQKQIDLMAKTINNAYFSENDFWSWFEKVFGIKPDGDYKKDIKQYFERKATNDS